MKYEETIEVISVNPAFDSVNGKTLYQVVFGKYTKLKNNLQGQLPGTDAATNQLILFIPKKNECQYKIGSKWHITVNETGSVSIVKIKKEEK
jgi:hypothetical protein